MKIAIINSVYKTGSTGRISFEMNHFFKNNGYDSKVFFGRGEPDRDAIRFCSSFSVLFHAGLSRIFDSSGFVASRHSTKRLIRLLTEYKPDLIVANNLHGYYLNFSLFMKYVASSKVKIIFVLHDCWLFTGHCAYFDLVNCTKWQQECNNCPNKLMYPKSVLFDFSRRNYCKKKNLFSILDTNNVSIVTPSNWLQQKVKSSLLRRFNSVVINNGIDTSMFVNKYRNLKINTSKKTVLSIANVWTEAKGLKDLIKLAAFFKDKDVKIVAIGKMKNKVELPANIFHVERTNNLKQLIEYYNDADVFFNPTYEDNYPTVNLEALACGLPVVSYNTGGSCEIIDKRYSVEKGDIKSACKKIQELLNNSGDYFFPDAISLSKEVSYKKYVDLIERLLNNEKI